MNMMVSNLQPAKSSIASRAVVASLSISLWSGRRLDRNVTDKVNREHNASADASRVNKLLLPKEALESINQIASETRAEFVKRTLPWMEAGGRIMAADTFLAFGSWFRGQVSKFDQAVEEMLRVYPTYEQNAPARLGSLYNEADFPQVFELRRKYGMEIKVLPVPSADDFRVAMSAAQESSIRAQIEATVNEATNAAIKNVYERIGEATSRMVERLTAYRPAQGKGDKSEGVFRDSLVENVRELIELLPSLNITGDPQLTAMADRLRPLAEFDASVLREDEGKRRDVAHEAQQILDSIGDFLA